MHWSTKCLRLEILLKSIKSLKQRAIMYKRISESLKDSPFSRFTAALPAKDWYTDYNRIRFIFRRRRNRVYGRNVLFPAWSDQSRKVRQELQKHLDYPSGSSTGTDSTTDSTSDSTGTDGTTDSTSGGTGTGGTTDSTNGTAGANGTDSTQSGGTTGYYKPDPWAGSGFYIIRE